MFFNVPCSFLSSSVLFSLYEFFVPKSDLIFRQETLTTPTHFSDTQDLLPKNHIGPLPCRRISSSCYTIQFIYPSTRLDMFPSGQMNNLFSLRLTTTWVSYPGVPILVVFGFTTGNTYLSVSGLLFVYVLPQGVCVDRDVIVDLDIVEGP